MNKGLAATLGKVGPNKGGSHGGVPIENKTIPDAPAEGSSGNPGTQLPWEGADATPKPGELPPLTSL